MYTRYVGQVTARGIVRLPLRVLTGPSIRDCPIKLLIAIEINKAKIREITMPNFPKYKPNRNSSKSPQGRGSPTNPQRQKITIFKPTPQAEDLYLPLQARPGSHSLVLPEVTPTMKPMTTTDIPQVGTAPINVQSMSFNDDGFSTVSQQVTHNEPIATTSKQTNVITPELVKQQLMQIAEADEINRAKIAARQEKERLERENAIQNQSAPIVTVTTPDERLERLSTTLDAYLNKSDAYLGDKVGDNPPVDDKDPSDEDESEAGAKALPNKKQGKEEEYDGLPWYELKDKAETNTFINFVMFGGDETSWDHTCDHELTGEDIAIINNLRNRGRLEHPVVNYFAEGNLYRFFTNDEITFKKLAEKIRAEAILLPAYYTPFLNCVELLYETEIYILFVTLIFADDIHQHILCSTIRKFLALLVYMDQPVLCRCSQTANFNFDGCIISRITDTAFRDEDKLHEYVMRAKRKQPYTTTDAEVDKFMYSLACHALLYSKVSKPYLCGRKTACYHASFCIPYYNVNTDKCLIKDNVFHGVFTYTRRTFRPDIIDDTHPIFRPKINRSRDPSPVVEPIAIKEVVEPDPIAAYVVKSKSSAKSDAEKQGTEIYEIDENRDLEMIMPNKKDDPHRRKNEYDDRTYATMKMNPYYLAQKNEAKSSLKKELNTRLKRLTEFRSTSNSEDRPAHTNASWEPMDTEGIKTTEQWRKKYGDFCVEKTGTIDVPLNPQYPGTTCTILQSLVPKVRGTPASFQVVQDDRSFGRQVGSMLYLPHRREAAVRLYANQYFERFIRKTENLNDFHVHADPLVLVEKGGELAAQVSLCDDIMDSKKATTDMQNFIPNSLRSFTEAANFYLTTQTDYHSMLSFFTLGWTQVLMLVDFEEMNREYEFGNLLPDDIDTFNVNGVNIEENVGIASRALNEGRITFVPYEVSPIDLMCMRVLSAGCQSIRTRNTDRYEHVGQHIKFENTPRWSIATSNLIPVNIPNNIAISAHNMITFLNSMCTKFHRNEDYVQGYIRASTMLAVRVKPVASEKGLSNFMINGALEVKGTSMPKSRGDNFFWRMTKVRSNRPAEMLYNNEVTTLMNCDKQDLSRTSILIGITMSLGYSHAWHDVNITGSNLSHAMRNTQHNRAAPLIISMIRPIDAARIPPISIIACNYVGQITSMAVPARAFTSSSWSFDAIDQAVEDVTHTWRWAWPNVVPYLIHPLIISFSGIEWDAKWGAVRPGVEGHFAREMREFQTMYNRAWYASAGDSKYKETAESQYPFRYIVYGAIAINTMMQEARAHVRPLRFEAIQHCREGSAAMPEPAFQPNMNVAMNNTLFMIRPGTLLTYSWERNVVYAPVILREEEAPELVQVLDVEKMTLFDRAGIYTPNQLTFTPVNQNLAAYIAAQSSGSRMPPAMATNAAVPTGDVTTPKVEIPPTTAKVDPSAVVTQQGAVADAVDKAAAAIGNLTVTQGQ